MSLRPGKGRSGCYIGGYMKKKILMIIVAVVFVIAAGALFELEQQSPYTIITNSGDYKVGFRDYTPGELEQTVTELRRTIL